MYERNINNIILLVTIAPEQTVKIVFVRDRRKKDWLALLSTDSELADTEEVRIYGSTP